MFKKLLNNFRGRNRPIQVILLFLLLVIVITVLKKTREGKKGMDKAPSLAQCNQSKKIADLARKKWRFRKECEPVFKAAKAAKAAKAKSRA